jgi:dimethylargininase
MTMPTRALVRQPPRSYREFYAARGVTIDMVLADAQHAAYVDALRASGLVVEKVPADENYPDGVFIEDTGVVWNGRMLVTRMTSHREGEQSGVRRHLSPTHEIIELPDAARLDGGDVLHTAEVTYVGLSSRTNAAGIGALREFLSSSGRAVIPVPVERCLHLKTAATWLGSGTLFVAAELVDVGRFDVDRIVTTPPGEAQAANTLRIGTSLLYRSTFPITARLLEEFASRHNLTARRLDLTEFEKGDGSLTCLSIII